MGLWRHRTGTVGLVLIADAIGNDEKAITWHQDLKWTIIQSLPDQWMFTRIQIRKILNDIKKGC